MKIDETTIVRENERLENNINIYTLSFTFGKVNDYLITKYLFKLFII
jgi:hypothetical protein